MDNNSANAHAVVLTNLCGDLIMGSLPPQLFADSVALISKEMGGIAKEEFEFEPITMHTEIESLEDAKSKMVDYLKDVVSSHIQVLKSDEAGVVIMTLPVYTGDGVCERMIGDADEDVIDWEPYEFSEIGKAS